jgi:hypothetical protein
MSKLFDLVITILELFYLQACIVEVFLAKT